MDLCTIPYGAFGPRGRGAFGSPDPPPPGYGPGSIGGSSETALGLNIHCTLNGHYLAPVDDDINFILWRPDCGRPDSYKVGVYGSSIELYSYM